MKEFVDTHWRDIVGLFILTIGIAIGIFKPESPLGLPLVMSGMTALKLPTKTNGGTNVQP